MVSRGSGYTNAEIAQTNENLEADFSGSGVNVCINLTG